jgi:hypothetical protein
MRVMRMPSFFFTNLVDGRGPQWGRTIHHDANKE